MSFLQNICRKTMQICVLTENDVSLRAYTRHRKLAKIHCLVIPNINRDDQCLFCLV